MVMGKFQGKVAFGWRLERVVMKVEGQRRPLLLQEGNECESSPLIAGRYPAGGPMGTLCGA